MGTIKAEDGRAVQLVGDNSAGHIMVQKVSSDENTAINIGLVILI